MSDFSNWNGPGCGGNANILLVQAIDKYRTELVTLQNSVYAMNNSTSGVINTKSITADSITATSTFSAASNGIVVNGASVTIGKPLSVTSNTTVNKITVNDELTIGSTGSISGLSSKTLTVGTLTANTKITTPSIEVATNGTISTPSIVATSATISTATTTREDVTNLVNIPVADLNSRNTQLSTDSGGKKTISSFFANNIDVKNIYGGPTLQFDKTWTATLFINQQSGTTTADELTPITALAKLSTGFETSGGQRTYPVKPATIFAYSTKTAIDDGSNFKFLATVCAGSKYKYTVINGQTNTSTEYSGAFNVTYNISANTTRFKFGIYAYSAKSTDPWDFYFGIKALSESGDNALTGATIHVAGINCEQPDIQLLATASIVKQIEIPPAATQAAGVVISDLVGTGSIHTNEIFSDNGYNLISYDSTTNTITVGDSNANTIITGSEDHPKYIGPDKKERRILLAGDISNNIQHRGAILFFDYFDPDTDPQSQLPKVNEFITSSAGDKTKKVSDYPTSRHYALIIPNDGKYVENNGPDQVIAKLYSITFASTTPGATTPLIYKPVTSDSLPPSWTGDFAPDLGLAFHWYIDWYKTDIDTFYHQTEIVWSPFLANAVGDDYVTEVNLALENYYDQLETDDLLDDTDAIDGMRPDWLLIQQDALIPHPRTGDMVPDPRYIDHKPISIPGKLVGFDYRQPPPNIPVNVVKGHDYSQGYNQIMIQSDGIRKYWNTVVSMPTSGGNPIPTVHDALEEVLLFNNANFNIDPTTLVNDGGKKHHVYDSASGNFIVTADAGALGGVYVTDKNTGTNPQYKVELTFPRIEGNYGNASVVLDLTQFVKGTEIFDKGDAEFPNTVVIPPAQYPTAGGYSLPLSTQTQYQEPYRIYPDNANIAGYWLEYNQSQKHWTMQPVEVV